MTKLNYVATLIGLLIVVVILLPTYLIGIDYGLVLCYIGLAILGYIALVALYLTIRLGLVGKD